MKIGIITYHYVYNCGAALQCFALQKVLKAMGHKPVVLDYRPWYLQNKYTHFKNPFEYYRNAFEESGNRKKALKAFFFAVKTWKNFFRAKKNDDKFRLFRKRYFNLTRTYRNIKQLQANPPACDAYISGSDQLWNPYLTNGKPDPAFFLDFGGKEKGRMTYAVGTSLCELEANKDDLIPLLKNFKHISLRETKCLSFLKSISSEDTDFHIDLDPTFLLKKEDYIPLESPKIKMDVPFILMYTMPDSSAEATRFAAQELGKKKGLPVIDIAMRRVKKDGKILDPHVAGADEFLAYINQAAYVYTNSFHGTAFSIIYQKQFMVVPHRKTGNRAIEILEKFGLQERWKKTGGETIAVMDEPIDYESVDKKRDELGNESLNYIKNSLENK